MKRFALIGFAVLAVLSIDGSCGRAMAQQTKTVEDIKIKGCRTIPPETVMLYIQTRIGDPLDKEQLQRDYQAVLALGYFDEFESRVYETEGIRGGAALVFSLKERPIILDIVYSNLRSIQESDLIQRYRERRISLSKSSRYDPVELERAKSALSEMLAEKGRPKARINASPEYITESSVVININADEGPRVRVKKIDFVGNAVFSDQKLRKAMKLVKESSFLTIFNSKDGLDERKLDEDLIRVRFFLEDNGYIKPKIGEPKIESVGSSGLRILLIGRRGEGVKITVPVEEGKFYRFGKVDVEGNSFLEKDLILTVIGIKQGETASGKVIREGVNERLRKLYGRFGYIEADISLKTNFNEATVDLTIAVEEGRAYTVRRIGFKGNLYTREQVLRREMLLIEMEPFNQDLLDLSRLRLNQLGLFDEIKESDVLLLTDQKSGYADIEIKVKEKGRQTISFSGGASSSGGNSIGVRYSTNNLLGYGESLAVDAEVGDLQRNLRFSFAEPYLFGRPVSLGFSVFTSRFKFIDGFSQNAAPSGSSLDRFLFTRSTNGFGADLSAPVSLFTKKYEKYARFMRVGLSYGYSSSKISDPQSGANDSDSAGGNVGFSQPKIASSAVTASFIYNTLNAAIDPTSGKQVSAQLGFSGLGGNVNLISPSLEIKYFRKVKRGEKPHVLGMRFSAQHVQSFGKPIEANSLAFIGGVPIFNRFFLGGDDSIRGYNPRSISPLAETDSFLTTDNIEALLPGTDRKLPILGNGRRLRGVDRSVLRSFTFDKLPINGNDRPLFTAVGADTQLLYNVEYRFPIAGPLTGAFFLDAGTAFNTVRVSDQLITTTTKGKSLSAVILNPRGKIATPEEIEAARTPETPVGILPKGFRAVTISGDSTLTSNIRISQSLGGFLTNFRSSTGVELRLQLPVVNLPLRLIFAVNPNARLSKDPLRINSEPKTSIRFSIGRTF